MRALGLLVLCFLQCSCASQEALKKINGVSFVASRDKATHEQVKDVLLVNANHAAVMPFGFIRNINSPEIIHNTDRQWFGETKAGAKQYIEVLHKNGVQVMVKPQIWIWKGEFTGTLLMNSEEHWKALEASYDDFILTYAKLAEETQVALFCIGTELERFVEHRPEYWKRLILKIRKVYKGKLTYAANWNEYTKTSFWEDLDYIGIDAYFPLSEEKNPTVGQLKEAWQPWKDNIFKLSTTVKRPVLFTEFGYRSIDYTARKPWLADCHEQKVNLGAQVNAKKAIFSEFWTEDWFAGGYVWKWFVDHAKSGGNANNQFTPQNKPAQQVITDFYKMY
ncbi:FIG01019911: hypothetical protein [hydrothermal vent metagenome]|uniref:Glycoside hydrolase n=1 Tax=hydrothermal vent metagenome TaxID=652676 RepID=A0A3B0T5X1_9ZZZZ